MSLARKLSALLGAGGDKLDPQFSTAPPGVIAPFAGTTEPDGWLLCYGQAISRTTYAALFLAIGTTYGAGNGTTTFNVPDLRGRACVGKDNMGGTAANRLTAASGITGTTLGAAGGTETHTLTTAQIPAHAHGVGTLATSTGGAHTHSTSFGETEATVSGASGRLTASGSERTVTTNSAGDHSHTITGNTANAGTGSAHPIVQPTIVLNSIIKT